MRSPIPFSVVCNGLDIVNSGSLLIDLKSSASIYFGPERSGFQIEVLFSDNSEDKASVQVEVVNQLHIKVVCNNFKSSVGMATTSPLHIANVYGRKLMMLIASTLIGEQEKNSVRLVHYMLGLGDPS